MTEEELINFLEDESQHDHLIWKGAFHPPKPTLYLLKPKVGDLRYERFLNPRPVLKIDGKKVFVKRLVFECYHDTKLPEDVHLRSMCEVPGCISPRHHKMLATYSHRWDRQALLPLLNRHGPKPEAPVDIDLDDPIFENVPTIMYMLRNFPENIQGFPPEAVEEAKRRVALEDAESS